MSNLSIRNKLLLSFAVVVAVTIILNVYGVVNVFRIDTMYSENIVSNVNDLQASSQALSSFKDMRLYVREFWIYANDEAKLKKAYENFTSAWTEFNKRYELLKDSGIDLSEFSAIDSGLSSFKAAAERVYGMVSEGDSIGAVAVLETEAIPASSKVLGTLENIYSATEVAFQTQSDKNTEDSKTIGLGMSAMGVIATILSLVCATLLATSLQRPIARIAEAAGRIANGDLSQDLATNRRDEIGGLSNSMALVTDTLNNLISRITSLSNALEKDGDLDASIDAGSFNGGYRDVAEAINNALRGMIDCTLSTVDCVHSFAVGDFDATIAPQPGKKAVINEAIDSVRNNLRTIVADAGSLANAAAAGDLGIKMDPGKYENGWADLAKSLNAVIEAVTAPVSEVMAVMSRVAEGDLDTRITGEYKGEYHALKLSVNKTVNQLSLYVDEISSVLTEMARDNLNVRLVQDYVGKFAAIGNSLNLIIRSFNETLREINSSADQVAAGARHIANSSMSLAQGAAEQTSAVEKLVTVLNDLNTQTHKSAEEARQANRLTDDASQKALVGNAEMGSMLGAMEKINEISTNISKIIQAIDDIAFQTNLLALNAAVEAARAGTHGKGFAVVADEVRNLANRSKKSAEEIAVFIQGSVEKIDEGTRIANQTASSLSEIVEQISDISTLIGGFAETSAAQEKGIADVSEGISQIATVTQTNTASSEEEAAFSQELSSQAEVFKNMVAKFKLKPLADDLQTNKIEPGIQKPEADAQKQNEPAQGPSNDGWRAKPAASRAIERERPKQTAAYSPAPVKPAEKPAAQAAKPAAKPIEKPAATAARPAAPAAGSAARPAAPAVPTTKPATPTTRPATPTTKPATPPARPATPTTRPATPTTRPATPTTRPATATARPAAVTGVKPAAIPAARPAATLPSGTPPTPSRSAGDVPSGASVYNKRDFGKY